jgi:hypothetical protein
MRSENQNTHNELVNVDSIIRNILEGIDVKFQPADSEQILQRLNDRISIRYRSYESAVAKMEETRTNWLDQIRAFRHLKSTGHIVRMLNSLFRFQHRRNRKAAERCVLKANIAEMETYKVLLELNINGNSKPLHRIP